MGDRAVFGFVAEDHNIIWLYSHWGGDEQLLTMQQAIRVAEPRWGDTEYATRIAISHIVGEQWQNETGYGLSVNTFTTPDYPYAYVVDWNRQTVQEVATHERDQDYDGPTYTFAQFLALEMERL